MVGTRLIQLHCVRAACSQKRPAENFGASARLPPCASGASMVTTRALMWYSGSTASTRSAGESSCSALMACALTARVRCVSSTPLGWPVVPEVYISSATASGGGGVRRQPVRAWQRLRIGVDHDQRHRAVEALQQRAHLGLPVGRHADRAA